VTRAGQRLRERADVDLGNATGLTAKDFNRLQKEIVTLRNNVLHATEQRDA
jgi:hypothetical protein